jgi:metal-responsive CopG/Arc/MetJ family transcriptional regulator
MATIKTAVSLREQLFKQVGALAREMKLSRSRLFAVALEEFIERHNSRELLDKINEAYKEMPSPAERTYMKKMRQRQRKAVDGQW